MSVTKEELQELVKGIKESALKMGEILAEEGGDLIAFLDLLNRLEARSRQLRISLVRHTREVSAGIKLNGKPDRRFKAHRSHYDPDMDARR